MLASRLNNKSVAIIDKNSKVGAKIKVSGGAKCNITNKYLNENNYLGDKEFIKTVLKDFSNHNLLDFLKSNGVNPNLNPKIVKGTYFCKSSQEPIDMFLKLSTRVKKFLNTEVKEVEFNNNSYKLKTDKGEIEAKKVVFASGGLSYSSLGVSSIAFDTAKKFGHEITRLEPALVGFTVQKEQFWFKKLSGLSLDVKIKVEHKEFEGSFLFTHKGCSGPTILNTSLYWKKGKIIINFAPNIDFKKVFKSNQFLSKAIHLPKRFIVEFLDAHGIKDKSASSLNESEKEIIKSIQSYEFSPAGNFGFNRAEVSRGGVETTQISEFCESKLQKNLFFIGECLDVTGELGGYNFQWAFASAVKCSYKI